MLGTRECNQHDLDLAAQLAISGSYFLAGAAHISIRLDESMVDMRNVVRATNCNLNTRGDIPALVYINTDLLNRRLAYTAEKVFV